MKQDTCCHLSVTFCQHYDFHGTSSPGRTVCGQLDSPCWTRAASCTAFLPALSGSCALEDGTARWRGGGGASGPRRCPVDCTPPAEAAPWSSSPCSSWLVGEAHFCFCRNMSRHGQSAWPVLLRVSKPVRTLNSPQTVQHLSDCFKCRATADKPPRTALWTGNLNLLLVPNVYRIWWGKSKLPAS